MALLKQCSKTGCTKIVSNGVIYCPYHQKKWEEQQHIRYKDYDSRRKADELKSKCKSFYQTDDWNRVRRAVIAECYYIDVLEYYRTGRVIQGDRVHHIVELSDDWNCRLDINNLICLTESNHRRVHEEYRKGVKEKKQMQEILFELLERWNEEFG